jgi:putative transposase
MLSWYIHKEAYYDLLPINRSWSMDFVTDKLLDERRIRALTIVGNFSRECLVIRVDRRLTGEDVVAAAANDILIGY